MKLTAGELRSRANIKRLQQRSRAKKFGLTLGQLNTILGLFPRCQVCESSNKLRIDHNHLTGKLRGVLCNSCNLILGHVKDDANRLRGLALYLLVNWETNETNPVKLIGDVPDPNDKPDYSDLEDPIAKLVVHGLNTGLIIKSKSSWLYFGTPKDSYELHKNGFDELVHALKQPAASISLEELNRQVLAFYQGKLR